MFKLIKWIFAAQKASPFPTACRMNNLLWLVTSIALGMSELVTFSTYSNAETHGPIYSIDSDYKQGLI